MLASANSSALFVENRFQSSKRDTALLDVAGRLKLLSVETVSRMAYL